ncbi:hypothetical protein KAH94_05745 [bacterium]|nr:hypothetical protein [bacterium]
MRTTKILFGLLLIFFIIVAGGHSFAAVIQKEIKTLRKKEKLVNLYSIEEINRNKFSFGTYCTLGYVVKKHECLECPGSAVCRACAPANIIISEEKEKKNVGEYELSDKDLIVFVEDDKPLKLGCKYLFLIQILNVKTMDQTINNVKLIYFKKMK